MNDCIAVIAAGGASRRCGALKQFAPLHGKTVLWYALQAFVDCPLISQIRVVVAAAHLETAQTALADCGDKVTVLPVGGATRGESVYNGLPDCPAERWIAVHDAARPCLSAAALQRLLSGGNDEAGAVLALPVAEALKTVAAGQLQAVVPRERVWAMQTPQLFRAAPLKRALRQYPQAADEAEAVLACGMPVKVIEGERRNIKITYPEDLELAEALLPLPAGGR